ncbi:MAG TPA: hypothetical protein VH877_02640 [Polyangia bacterium]|nr:hypothetical protein [Polyangia bacterium]
MADLTYHDTIELLRRLQGTGVEVVIVGGQAVNFWAEQFRHRVPELAESGSFTSKDIDLLGDRDAVEACAASLHGRSFLPDPFEPTPNSGAVVFHDSSGMKVEIDFLRQVFGVDEADIQRTKIPIEILDEQGRATAIRFWVMQPVLCMESRACNVVGLPGHDTPHARRQLQASIYCAREFLRDLLAAERAREVLRLNERIFGFCTKDPIGRRVFQQTGMDPFDAVIAETPLPARFLTQRYPQMRSHLDRLRSRWASMSPPR